MDFWASVAHAIYHKYDATVPRALLEELTDAARTAADLDHRMTRLPDEVRGLHKPPA